MRERRVGTGPEPPPRPRKIQAVSETHESLIQRVGQWGGLARAATLLILLSLFFVLAAPVAVWQFGKAGLWAAVVATAICLTAGWLAMAATAVLAPPHKPAAHVLVGMALRMSLPLLACLLIDRQFAWLMEAGFAWLLVPAFCLGLAFETVVSVGQLQALPSPAGRAIGSSAMNRSPAHDGAPPAGGNPASLRTS
jgi:hypothetical protein